MIRLDKFRLSPPNISVINYFVINLNSQRYSVITPDVDLEATYTYLTLTINLD